MLSRRLGRLLLTGEQLTELNELKKQILQLTREYSLLAHASNRPGGDPLRTPWPPAPAFHMLAEFLQKMRLRQLLVRLWTFGLLWVVKVSQWRKNFLLF